jgi:hypothetical protein
MSSGDLAKKKALEAEESHRKVSFAILEGVASTVDSQIQHRLEHAAMPDDFKQDELKWMRDEAIHRASYTIARAFDTDEDAQYIREKRAGISAPTTLAMVQETAFDTRSLGPNWSGHREANNGLLTILSDKKGPQIRV